MKQLYQIDHLQALWLWNLKLIQLIDEQFLQGLQTISSVILVEIKRSGGKDMLLKAKHRNHALYFERNKRKMKQSVNWTKNSYKKNSLYDFYNALDFIHNSRIRLVANITDVPIYESETLQIRMKKWKTE